MVRYACKVRTWHALLRNPQIDVPMREVWRPHHRMKQVLRISMINELVPSVCLHTPAMPTTHWFQPVGQAQQTWPGMGALLLWHDLCAETGRTLTARVCAHARFLVAIEDGYNSERDNPYHNRTHACDVLRTLHIIMTRGGVKAALHKAQDIGLIAAYLAAVIHVRQCWRVCARASFWCVRMCACACILVRMCICVGG